MFRFQFAGDEPRTQGKTSQEWTERDFEIWCNELRRDIVGEDLHIGAAFGPRRLIYADYTASGRSVRKIENFIQEKVLPYYGNTHTLTTATARQTTNFRNEARNIVRHYVNADPQYDAVIFVESGCTGAVNKFVGILNRLASWTPLRLDKKETAGANTFLKDRWGSVECNLCKVRLKNENVFRSHCQTPLHTEKMKTKEDNAKTSWPQTDELLVLADPWAHHSSSLPFRELRSTPLKSVQYLELDEDDFEETIVEKAKEWNGPCFAILSAGSNVTGAVRNVPELTEALHRAGCRVGWDFASVAGHRRIDLNPKEWGEGAKVDVAFFSPHKLLGGPGSSGVLVAKKALLQNTVPAAPGGGTVFYVTSKNHSYIQTAEDREEAGTPNIVGCIRTGLVYHLANQAPHSLIAKLENSQTQFLLNEWEGCNIEILGSELEKGLGIISFMIPHKGLYLHYNFVVCLLNDLFGVQSRGGCMCSGPLAQILLGMDHKLSQDFESMMEKSGVEVIRPGFVRLGVHFTMSEEDLEVVACAVKFVSEYGHKLLPLYTFDIETGEWELRGDSVDARRQWLTSLDFRDNKTKTIDEVMKKENTQEVPLSAPHLLDVAMDIVATVKARVKATKNPLPVFEANVAPYLWFALPNDVGDQQHTHNLIFHEDIKRPDESLFKVRNMRGRASFANTVTTFGEVNIPGAPPPTVPEKQDMINGYPKLAVRPIISKALSRSVGKAIADLEMIKDGDRLLIGLSGGKDSMCLLHILRKFQKSAPIKFEIAAATVDPMTPEYDPSPLVDYLKAVDVTFHLLRKPLIEMAKNHMDPKKQSICAFCARMKRGILYSCCRENNYNVLVLGQHLDDLAESFIMSSFRNGCLKTMKGNYYVADEDIRVIRPLMHTREKSLADTARENGLPIIADNCPACFAEPKERHRVKLMLAREEFEHPNLFSSLSRAISPLTAVQTASRLDDAYAPLATSRHQKRARAKKENEARERGETIEAGDPKKLKGNAAADDRDAEEILLPCSTESGVCPIFDAVTAEASPPMKKIKNFVQLQLKKNSE